MDTTLENLMNEAGITASIREDWNDNAPEWAIKNRARHYRVTLRYQKRSMSLWWYQGNAITREPRAWDIMENLLLDLNYEQESLDDFISELGLRIESVADFRAHENAYKQLIRQNQRLTRLIGNPELITRLQEVAA
jgi:hypothetical protein